MLMPQLAEKMQRLPQVVPCITNLPDKRAVIIDTMTDDHIADTFAMIKAAAVSGNGFGVDEYGSETDFREDINGGFNFAIFCKDTGDMIAVFVLAISKYYRGCCVADPFIIVSEKERGKGVGEFCLQLCVEFGQRLGFLGMYVDTFSNNRAMLKIINNVGGFTKVGYLPMGGKMTDGSIVGSIIFYKDLNP